jgi:hypothetical protein
VIMPHEMMRPHLNISPSSETQLVLESHDSQSPRMKFIKMKFKVNDPDEKVIDNFNCAVSVKILLQGILYVTDRSLYFYSSFNDTTLIGHGTKIRIPFRDIDFVKKARSILLFNKSLKVVMKNQTEILFANFFNRAECFRKIELQRFQFIERQPELHRTEKDFFKEKLPFRTEPASAGLLESL